MLKNRTVEDRRVQVRVVGYESDFFGAVQFKQPLDQLRRYLVAQQVEHESTRRSTMLGTATPRVIRNIRQIERRAS